NSNRQSLWIGGKNKMLNWDWDSGKVTDFSYLLESSPLSGTAYASLVDKNGQIWLGTGDGLFVYNQEESYFESYFSKAQTGEQISLRGIAVEGPVIYANSYMGTVSLNTQTKDYRIDLLPFIQGHFLS